MDTVVFNKEDFKKSVLDNVKNIYRKNIDEATKQQVFQAVAYAVKDDIIDRWIATQKAYEKQNAKTVYYLSMEFLMGRALGNNMINLTCYEQVKEALDAGADIIMLDNMDNDTMRKAVEMIGDKAQTECSGNVTKERLKEIAEIGVDFVSCGALTHSAMIMDVSLKNLTTID